ncbi:helix-turn-helix domain-containing protein [Prevotella falsenii]|uniref:helix-turn-helix domain-containing protein n=1 Tax=Prevotella falsenii TaxID=515414 RepID=UPI000469A2F5|nr:helix-turn-helix domain-containing protein [Prevotella falsenii]
MKKKALTAVCLLIALIANAQNFSSDINRKNKGLGAKPGTDAYRHSSAGGQKSNNNNPLIDFKTYSNDFLLKEASAYIYKKNYMDSALMCYSIIYKRYAENKETVSDTMLTKTLNGLWYIYFFHYYDYIKSNEILKESLNVCKERKLNSAWVYLDFGFMYQMIAEQSMEKSLYRKAFEYYKSAFHEARKYKDWGIMLNAFGNIVMVSTELQGLRSIHSEVAAFKQIPKDFNALEYEYDSLLYSGVMALERNDIETALKCFKKQLLLFKNFALDYARYAYLAHINLAKGYNLQGNYEKALQELKIGVRISADFETKDTKLEAYKLLHETYTKIGDARQATTYQNKYVLLKDSLLNYRLIAGINEMEFENKMKDVELHLKQLEHQKEIQRIVIFLFMIIGGIVAVSLLLITSKNKKLNQSNQALFRKNIELFQSEEKERLRRQELEEQIAENKQERKYKSSNLSDRRKEELLQKVLTLMDNDDCIYLCDFSANQLAAKVGVNYKYISQVINEMMHCSFSNLLNKYRIKEACKRIEDKERYSGFTLEAIGNSVGFKSRSSFIAAFKQITGLTPFDFQRNIDAKAKVISK